MGSGFSTKNGEGMHAMVCESREDRHQKRGGVGQNGKFMHNLYLNDTLGEERHEVLISPVGIWPFYLVLLWLLFLFSILGAFGVYGLAQGYHFSTGVDQVGKAGSV
jgi:hypothetical protein